MTLPTQPAGGASIVGTPLNQADDYVPILIVGAGPTGLTLANLLGVYQARTLLIERNQATVTEPRAVSIDDESLRTMQAIGLGEIVLQSVVAGYGSDYLTPHGRCFLTVEPTGTPYGFPRRNAFRQPQLEAQLQTGTNRFATLDIQYGCTLSSFAQDAHGVTAQLVDQNGVARQLRCDYLIGCDGASSTVRKQLGLSLEGKSFAQRWLIVDLQNSPAERRNTVVFCNSQRPCIALPGPDLTRRFEFKLHAHERDTDMLKPEVVSKLLRAHGAHKDSLMARKVVYTFHARVAPRWSQGRVFLAGDACHLTPPFAGQGMNSGVRDSSNLAWKLALVTTGRMSTRLLTTYEAERRKHVWQMIQLALRMGRIMSPGSKLGGLLVQTAFLAMGWWPAAKRFFAEMKYKPKPKFDAGFMHADNLSARHTLVGRMLEQPRVVTIEGAQLLLDDLLGNGFALLGIEVAAYHLHRLCTDAAIVPLAPACVAINAPAGSGDSLVRIAHLNDYSPAFKRYRGRILLVRPDRYVAASGTPVGSDSIAVAIATLLSRWTTSCAEAGHA